MTIRTRALVTGAAGFVGRHVVEDLTSYGFEVVGLGRTAGRQQPSKSSQFIQADLTKPWPQIRNVAYIVHLAGLSAVGPSFDNPQRYIDVNGSIILQMAAWAKKFAPVARAVVVSSGSVYDSSSGQTLTEESAIACTSPYVVSKLLVENLTQFHRRRGLDWLIARPFNHIGPGQQTGFLVPDLTRQLQARLPGNPIHVGNLESARDYADVRDVARAYRMLALMPGNEETVYNVCSGEVFTGSQLLSLIVDHLGESTPPTALDAGKTRPEDPALIVGSAAKLHRDTGWEPRTSVARSVGDFLDEFHHQHGVRP